MATQYNSIIRLLTIDDCIRSKQYYDLPSLITAISKKLAQYDKAIKVSPRTVYDDLRFLKDSDGPFAAPITKTRERGYHYTDQTYGIFQSRDDLGSVEQLQAGITALRQVSRMQGFEELRPILFRLEANYTIDSNEVVAPIVYLEQGLNLEGQSKIEEVKTYILDRVAMSITYQPFDREATNRVVSPYFIKEYNNRWFLFGYEHTLKPDAYSGTTTVALDRIVNIKASTLAYHADEDIDPRKHFEDIVGVTVPNKEVEEVTFVVSGTRRHYVATKKLHPSQRVVSQTDNTITFRLSVIPNRDLYSKLLSFGSDLEVIEPEELRQHMQTQVIAMATLYA